MSSRARAVAVLSVLGRIVVVLLFFVAWWTTYDLVNGYAAGEVRTIRLTPPRDYFPGVIQPWTFFVYFPGGLVLPALPFLYYRSWPRVGFVLACYTISSVIAFVCYCLWPLSIDRPAFDGSRLGESCMRWLVSVDQAANCCPSSHVLYAVLPALLVSVGGASLRAAILVWVFAVAVCVSTITTGQHYLIDIPGGVAVALVGYGGARALQAAWGPRRARDGRLIEEARSASEG
jgi:hypothetical protein